MLYSVYTVFWLDNFGVGIQRQLMCWIQCSGWSVFKMYLKNLAQKSYTGKNKCLLWQVSIISYDHDQNKLTNKKSHALISKMVALGWPYGLQFRLLQEKKRIFYWIGSYNLALLQATDNHSQQAIAYCCCMGFNKHEAYIFIFCPRSQLCTWNVHYN